MFVEGYFTILVFKQRHILENSEHKKKTHLILFNLAGGNDQMERGAMEK